MKQGLRRSSAVPALLALASACVPVDAGYQDVRRTTAARLPQGAQDVRWARHEAKAPTAEVRALLERPLNADAAVRVALLNNARLQAAFEELGVARARLVQALALPNPSVEGALHFHGGAGPDLELGAMIDLSDLFFLPAAGGPAKSALKAAQASVAGQALDLALEARVAFYEYQAAQQILELRSTIVDALGASFDAARRLYEAGNITDLAFASEQALYEEGRVAFTQAEAEVQARREQLAAVLGVWGADASFTTEPRLSDELAPDDGALQGVEARAIERSLDLEIARLRFEAAAKGANLATARGWVPELRAGVSAERDDGEWGVGPAVELELPLFYQGQGESAAAEAEARRQRKLHTELAVRIRATARALASRLRSTTLSLEQYQTTLLPLREHIVSETQLQYNAMNVGLFQLLQAKRDQIETGRRYIELLRGYWVTKAELDQLVAGRLPAGAGARMERSEDAATSTGAGSGAAH